MKKLPYIMMVCAGFGIAGCGGKVTKVKAVPGVVGEAQVKILAPELLAPKTAKLVCRQTYKVERSDFPVEASAPTEVVFEFGSESTPKELELVSTVGDYQAKMTLDIYQTKLREFSEVSLDFSAYTGYNDRPLESAGSAGSVTIVEDTPWVLETTPTTIYSYSGNAKFTQRVECRINPRVSSQN
jgi:hypothetical protein